MATAKSIEYTIGRQCTGTWRITPTANWISVTSSSTQSNTYLNISVNENTTASARTGNVNIFLNDSITPCKSITVRQDKPGAVSCSCPQTYGAWGSYISRSGATSANILKLEVDSGFSCSCSEEMYISADTSTFLSSSTFTITCSDTLQNNHKVINVIVHNVPENTEQTGIPRVTGFYIMLDGEKCTTNYPIFQEGKTNCKCDGIIDPDTGGMITILDNAVDNGAHTNVLIASADTNGCGTLELSNTSTGVFVNDQIRTVSQPSGVPGGTLYYWYADVLANSAGGTRSVSLDVTYIDLFNRVLPCQDKVLFTQGEGLCSCPAVTPLSSPLTCNISGDGTTRNPAYLYNIFTGLNFAYNMVEDTKLYCNFIYAESEDSWLRGQTMYSGNNLSFMAIAERNATCNERTGTIKLYSYRNLSNGSNYSCQGEYGDCWVDNYNHCGTKCVQVGTVEVTQSSASTKFTCANTQVVWRDYYYSTTLSELNVSPDRPARFTVMLSGSSSSQYYSAYPKSFEIVDSGGNPVDFLTISGSYSNGYTLALAQSYLEVSGTYYLDAVFEVDCGVICKKRIPVRVAGCCCKCFNIQYGDTIFEIPGSEEGNNYHYINLGCQLDFQVLLCTAEGSPYLPVGYYDWIDNLSYDNNEKRINYTVTANTTTADRVAYVLIRAYHMVNGQKVLCEDYEKIVVNIVQERDVSNPCLWCGKKLGITSYHTYHTWGSGDTTPLVIATLYKTDSECPDGSIQREFEIASGYNEFRLIETDNGNSIQVTLQPIGTNTSPDDYYAYVRIYAKRNGEYITDYNNRRCEFYFSGKQQKGQLPPPEPCSCDDASYYISTINKLADSLVEGQRVLVGTFVPIDKTYSRDSCLEYVDRNQQQDVITVEVDTTNGEIYVTALVTTKPEGAGKYHTAAFDINIYNSDELLYCNVSETFQLDIYWQN